MQKPVHPTFIEPPPTQQRVSRGAQFAEAGAKRSRYSIPSTLSTGSPVGYRTRVSMSREQGTQALSLLSLERPTGFAPGKPISDQFLFDEASLGVLTARQSTNYRGHKQVSLGPDDSAAATHILRRISGLEAPVLDGAELTHLVLTRPYRTPFTLLLTFIGHSPIVSLGTVPFRAFRKKFKHANDIPTIGYLQQLHVGILADAMERATVIASGGERRALVFMAPFSASKPVATNVDAIRELEALAGVSNADRRAGWSIAIVAQVGQAVPKERIDIPNSTCRILGANLMAFRSERIQPGVNQEPKAPAPYQVRQDMDVPDELTVMAGRAAYNAFTHWTGCDRDRSKELFLLERVDVLSPHGKRRLREIRSHLGEVTDQVVQRLPKWIDWPTGRFLSKSAEKGRKAFALAGQRIYIVGLSKREIAQDDMDWDLAVRATGAACSRGALVAEIMGATDIPEGCDLLAGICLMAGPVNQNDIGKSFYGAKDLLAGAFPDRDPTSLLVWTLKAKTVADPIGNEEQLMNPKRKGALVDLRLGPHEAVFIRKQGVITPFRKRDDQVSEARAFAEIGNFVVDSHGKGVPGNEGTDWPFANESVW